MRQIAILALIILAVSAADMKINCTALSKPAYNFYKPPTDCMNDTAVKACTDAYDTCVAAATTCTVGLDTCVVKKLRCFETAAPTTTACTTWLTMFSNEKLYITAGGDYNGSSLEVSCRQAVCDFEAAKQLDCSATEQKDICKDMLAVSVPSTIPPAGRPVVVFTIAGDKTKLGAWLNKDRTKAFAVVGRMLAKILQVDAGGIVIIDIKIGSLVVDFYTTDASLDVTTVQTRITAAKADTNQAQYFSELATDAGVDVSTMSISSFTVAEATAAPTTTSPSPSTPAPGNSSTPAPLAPASASAVATAIAVVAAVAAMLF